MSCRRPWIVVLGVGLLLGCGPGSDTTGDAWLEVGGGEWQFEPLEDGQSVELVRGSQGGYHVWVSFRASGIEPDGVRASITTEILDRPGSESGSTVMRDLDPGQEPGTHVYIGWPAVIPEAGCADGQRVEVGVTLTDARGVMVADQRVVVPHATVEPPECL